MAFCYPKFGRTQPLVQRGVQNDRPVRDTWTSMYCRVTYRRSLIGRYNHGRNDRTIASWMAKGLTQDVDAVRMVLHIAEFDPSCRGRTRDIKEISCRVLG